ncbi:hypothetical protein IJJ53_01440 [Candidatus Saccharibacteria bacterium]|nr:hypothetical protein [Candidatus Saccharibacteria bacterium]
MKLKFTNKMKGANKSKLNNVANARNRQCLSADGFSLLPSALRPCLFCLALVLVFCFTALGFYGSSSAYATTSTLTVNIAGSISLDLNPIYPAGTFAESSSSNNISVYTNHSSGYTLGIAAKVADSNALVYSDTSTGDTIASVPSIISAVSSSNYADNAYASSNKLNDTWGYKPSTIYNTSTNTTEQNSDYLPAPISTTNQTILAKTTTATTENTTDNYNITMGARVSSNTPTGSYGNTFVITVVANPIPYTISYNKNTEDTVTNIPSPSSGNADGEIVTNAITNTIPKRTGYAFIGWCGAATTIIDNTDNCSGTIYNPDGNGTNRNYTIDQTGDNTNIVLYAMWQKVYNITFSAGENIETLIVADSGSRKWKPYYITTDNSKTFSNVPTGRRYAVTVIPNPNYKLGSWASTSGSTANLANAELLTTMYTVGTVDETLTATGTSGSYTNMKDFAVADCIAGANVTDERDGKSYTVAPFTNTSTNTTYCYMLSNLRLDEGITLNSDTSDINPNGVTYTDPTTNESVTATTFTTPTEAWISSSQNYYCKAIMKHYNQNNGGEYRDEYYYNWYAAKANPYQCLDPTSDANATSTNDSYSLGSICPKNWKLPTYDDATPGILWDGNNTGMLASFGRFYSGSQYAVNDNSFWWSKARREENTAYGMGFTFYAYRSNYGKYLGGIVRCARST